MSLQNAFAIGSCAVVVNHKGAFIWAGNLTPGETSTNFNGFLGGEVLQAAVTSEGIAQLSWVSGSGPADGYELGVVPNYSMLGVNEITASSLDIPSGVSANAYATADSTASNGISITGSGSVWTPDPCDVTSTYSESDDSPGVYVSMGYTT